MTTKPAAAPPHSAASASLIACFQDQVARDPHGIAVATPDETTTYDELSRRSSAITAALGERGLGDDARIAVLVGLGVDGVAATLGVLSAGLVAAPLSISDPAPRLARHRELVDPAIVIVADPAGRDLAERSGFAPDRILTIPAEPAAATAGRDVDPEALALLITTSGSTGQPKAVMHSNRSLLDNARRYRVGLGVTATDRIASHAPLSGGQGIVAMTAALVSGATLCPFPLAERGAAGFSSWLRSAGITMIDTLPSVMRLLASTLSPDDIAGIRVVRIASEPAYRADYATFRQTFPPSSRLVHVLAAAETGIIAQHECSDTDFGTEPGRLPVGRPVEGVDVDVIDDDGRPAPDGAIGTLSVSGADIALGYWRAEPSDSARFTTGAAGRRFHSADLAVMTGDGLVMQGRADLQVKIRGHRVQLDEIEAVLLRDPAVSGAGVVPVTTSNGDIRLVARVIAQPGQPIEVAALRAKVAAVLPAYAVPAQLEVVAALPVTSTGKLDRRALSAGVIEEHESGVVEPAEIATASDRSVVDHVAAIWSRAFGVDAIDRSTGFLQLGGDSLLAAVIGALIDDDLDVALTMAYFRSDPTIEQLAQRIEAGETTGETSGRPLRPLRRASPDARAVPSYIQLGMLATTGPAARATQTNVAVPYRIDGDLDVDALERAIDDVANRHEILRTTYPGDGMPRVTVGPPARVPFEIEDLRDNTEPILAATEVLNDQGEQPFDLATGPLLRFALLRVTDTQWRLHRHNHHVLADNWSWQIFFEEVAARYQVEVSTPAPTPSEPPLIQYADFAAWERATFDTDSEELDAEVGWWEDRLADFSAGRVAAQLRRSDSAAPPDQRVVQWGLAAEVSDALDALGREVGATYFDSRLALVSAVVAITARSRDIPVWTQMTNRTSTVTLRMIGPVINSVLLPLRFEPELTMREWMRQVHRVVTEVTEHSAIPRLVLQAKLRDRGLINRPWPLLFQADQAPTELGFGGVTLRALPRRHINPGGVEISVAQHSRDSRCAARFNPHGIDAAAIAAITDRLADFAAQVTAAPDQPIASQRIR